jgi:WD40 repeat protein
MVRFLSSAAVFFIAVAFVVAQDGPSPLEKLEPAKLPPAIRPAKGLPPETLANISQRADRVDCYAFRGDGKFFAISGPDQIIRIWSADTLKLNWSAKQPDSIVCLAFAPESKTFVAGDASGNLRFFDKSDTRTPLLKVALPGHKDGPVWSVAFSPDGKRLASGGRDKTLKIWDLTKARPGLLATVSDHKEEVRGVAYSPDGKMLISVCPEEKTFRVWDVTKEKPKAGEVVKLPAPAIGVNFSPDGNSIVLAGSRGTGAVWSLKDGKFDDPVDLETDKRTILMANFSADGSLIAGVLAQSRTEDRIVVWSKDGKKKNEIKYDAHVHAAGFAPDNRHLVAVTEIGTYIIRLPK